MTPVARNVFYFLGAVVLAKGVGAISSFLIPKLLPPADYGVWVTLTLVVSYSSILLLGSLETLVKQYPFYVGAGEPGKAEEIERAVLGSVGLSVVVVLVVALIFPFVWASRHGTIAGVQLGLMMANAMLSLYASFYYYRFTAHQDFRRVSIIDTSRSIASIVFLVILSWQFGLMGTVVGSLINEVFVVILTLRLNNRAFRPISGTLNPALLWKVLRIGFPITIIWWVFILQTSVDRILAMTMLGKEATGFYGLGVGIASALVLIPMALGRVLYPRINQEVGGTSNRERLEDLVVAPAQALSVLLPFLIAVLVFLTPGIFVWIFPKYRPGLASAQILLLGTFFVSLIRSGVNYLVAINRQNRVFVYVLITLAVTLTLGYWLVTLGWNISGIAAAAGVAGFLLATLVWQAAFFSMGLSRHDQLKGILALYWPFLMVLMLVGLVYAVYPQCMAIPTPKTFIVGALLCATYWASLAVMPTTRRQLIRLYGLLRKNVGSVRAPRTAMAAPASLLGDDVPGQVADD